MLPAAPAHAQDAKLDAMRMQVSVAFDKCAADYRQSMTGNRDANRPFDCVMRSAKSAGDTVSTLGINVTFDAANAAAERYISDLVEETRKAFFDRDGNGNHTAIAYLASLASIRQAYSDTLCNLWGDIHFGGTITSSNRSFCQGRQHDQQIDDLLRLLKEYGVIPNGR